MSIQPPVDIAVYAGQIPPSDHEVFILNYLQPLLPYSLPLYRRCQFHRKSSKPSATGEIWIAAAVKDQNATIHDGGSVDLSRISDLPWVAAHIDLTNAGQTQVWTCATWEAQHAGENGQVENVQKSPHFIVYQRLMDALFEHIRTSHVKNLSHDPPVQWQRLRDDGKIVSLPYSRSKVLFGTIAECLWTFLDSYNSSSGSTQVTRADRPYLKYIVESEVRTLRQVKAPEGLHFAPMQEQHLQTIVDRTNIPRTIETLRQLPNAGLFNSDNMPVAWGLLGKDASLSSLHTEPEYRRRGLAETIANKLMAEQISAFQDAVDSNDDAAIVYSHADVSTSNLASSKVMEKIGGKVMWRVAWIEVQLGEPMIV
ncbi:hypothetical protein H2198_005955 [Neophaeococcomyces mojaviensis]|uniref:Uncharacterized protein n=1 Tax=Neophaeococcomyces mojaviensis TaxID=3383035 RepID=A0ACC3A4D6_9EURO|nr:hypothetical protein H2198_005955 [Knufia sp. JES_112]